MSDLITEALNRMVEGAWQRSLKRGESIEEMKNGALDLITKRTEKSNVGLPNMAEAFNQAEDHKS